MKLVLASASPRRRELLQSIGLEFETIPAHVEEVPLPDESVQDYVQRLALEKAGSVATDRPDHWIIAADTVVFVDGRMLEKPRDAADAVEMLSLLAGRSHTVYSGLALVGLSRDHRDCRLANSLVRITPLSRSDIEWYVATGEPMDKAGAYAVQGIGAMFIDGVEGSYTNVVGLPLAVLFRMLRLVELDPITRARIPAPKEGKRS